MNVIIEVGNIQKLPLANFELLLGDTLKIKPKNDITIGGRLSKELTKRKELCYLLRIKIPLCLICQA